jgi:hypothetical protein
MKRTKPSIDQKVRLYVKDSWKPSMMPGVRFHYCVFDFGYGALTMYLFETIGERNYRIRKRGYQGYACKGLGTVMWKGEPGARR